MPSPCSPATPDSFPSQGLQDFKDHYHRPNTMSDFQRQSSSRGGAGASTDERERREERERDAQVLTNEAGSKVH